MKLFYIPGACSLSSHIVLRELGLPFELERVDTKAGRTASGADFRKLNPKGYVPVLQLDDGQVITECAAIVQYLADRKPEARLAPPAGTLERTRLQEWLNYIAAELHKGFGPLFNPKLAPEARQAARGALEAKLGFVASGLEGKSFLLGEGFSVADAYLFVVLSWAPFVGLDLGRWPRLQAFVDRVAARPAVQAARKAEAEAGA